MIQLHGNPQSPEHHGANLEQVEGNPMPNCFAFTQARPAVCSQFKISNTATKCTSQQTLPDSALQHTGCSRPSAWIAAFNRPILCNTIVTLASRQYHPQLSCVLFKLWEVLLVLSRRFEQPVLLFFRLPDF